MNKYNGFTLIELLIVLILVIINTFQIKIVAEDLIKDLEFKDYSLIISIILAAFLFYILAMGDVLWDKKNLFFKFLSIILAIISVSQVAYCLYHLRDSFFFIIFNLVFGYFTAGMWFGVFFEKRKFLKKRKK